MHAVITMAAMQPGKHVYCQKPLTHTVFEARTMTEAAREHKVATQMGNQGHSFESMRLLKEWLDDGAIGNVTEVHAWTDRPVGGDPWSDFAVQARPTDTPPVPETLDWDRWLGPVAVPAVPPCLSPAEVASLARFRHRPARRHGLPHPRSGLLGARAGTPQSVEATSTHYEPPVASETYPRASNRPLRVSGPRHPATGEAHLVRRPSAAAGARRSWSRAVRCRAAAPC